MTFVNKNLRNISGQEKRRQSLHYVYSSSFNISSDCRLKHNTPFPPDTLIFDIIQKFKTTLKTITLTVHSKPCLLWDAYVFHKKLFTLRLISWFEQCLVKKLAMYSVMILVFNQISKICLVKLKVPKNFSIVIYLIFAESNEFENQWMPNLA